MKITFHKYEGTGNDFILIDNRRNVFDASRIDLVKKLCDRKFGIGSDGLMLLQNKEGYDFEMIFFNPDGSKSLCGNGSRCIVEFAKTLGIVNENIRFVTYDGEHEAHINEGIVCVKMNDVKSVEIGENNFILNTGSPHYCTFVSDIQHFNVFKNGKIIRNNERFRREGINVNFLEKNGNAVFVRTYERGVENETLSCGTGVTAAALVASLNGISTSENYCEIKTLGGNLKVKFKKNADNSFSEIWLEGQTAFIFKGEIEI